MSLFVFVFSTFLRYLLQWHKTRQYYATFWLENAGTSAAEIARKKSLLVGWKYTELDVIEKTTVLTLNSKRTNLLLAHCCGISKIWAH